MLSHPRAIKHPSFLNFTLIFPLCPNNHFNPIMLLQRQVEHKTIYYLNGGVRSSRPFHELDIVEIPHGDSSDPFELPFCKELLLATIKINKIFTNSTSYGLLS